MEMEVDWQLKCKDHSQRLGYMLKSGAWTDCKFLVGQEPHQEVIEGHKMVLASVSPVFAAMFYGVMAEHQSPIPISDIQPETFRTLLTNIYAETEDVNSFDEACNLYYAADKYSISALKEKLLNYMKLQLEKKIYICRIYEFALLYEIKELKDRCLELMSSNTKEVFNDNSFLEAQMSTVVKIFRLDTLSTPEPELFEALELYVEAQEQRNESSFNSNNNEPEDVMGNVQRGVEIQAHDNMRGTMSKGKRARREEPEPSPSAALKQIQALVLTVEQLADGPAKSTLLTQLKELALLMNIPTDRMSTECKKKPDVRAALKQINFLLFTAKQFAAGPANSDLLTESQKFAILMNIVMKDSLVPMPKGFSTYRGEGD